jgi:hypothetical protein
VGYAKRDIECVGDSGTIGALLPNGNWFDLELPFGFPFADVLHDVNGMAVPK